MTRLLVREIILLFLLSVVSDYHLISCSSLKYESNSDGIEGSVEEEKRAREKRFIIDNGEEETETTSENSSFDGDAFNGDDETNNREDSSEGSFDFAKNAKPIKTTTTSALTNRPSLFPSRTPRYTEKPLPNGESLHAIDFGVNLSKHYLSTNLRANAEPMSANRK